MGSESWHLISPVSKPSEPPSWYRKKPLNVIQATNADSDRIIQLIYSVLREYGLQPDPGGTDLDLADIESHYTNNGGYFGLLYTEGAEGEMAATVGIRRIDADTCELRKMYMLPHMRGRGLGRQLLEYALGKAAELGYRRVTLETASPLKEAIALYQKYGFTEIYPEHLSNRCDKAFELYLVKE